MQKVLPGEKVELRARTWNSFLAAADYVKNRQSEMKANRKAVLPAGMVYVRNDSGEDLEIYSVMSLPDLVISPEDNENFQFGDIVFSADIASEDNDGLPLCILQQPLSADEVGRALVLGVTHGTVDVSDPSHRFAIPSYDEPGGLVSAESGTIEIMWKGEETGEQECILKMGGSGAAGECSFPFQLYVTTDEIGDPILCMIPGQITIQTTSTMNANFRFGESDSFRDEEVIDFDFNNVADGDYLVLGWVKLSVSGNVDCGILIGRDDEMNSTFEYPTGCGFFVFPIGVVEKTGDEEDFPVLSVTKQFACGTFAITDHYYNLPFVPHIQVDVPETNELAVPGDIQAVRAQIINAPCYSDKEEKYSDIADKGTELEPGNTYYAYIEDTENNVTLVWSNEELDAYEASDETEFELEDNESEGTIKRTLVAEISYGSDGLFQTHHHHLAPYRIVDSESSYMVLVNEDDETPGYLEDKLEADLLDDNEDLIYPEDEPGYIKHILNEDYSGEDLNLSLRTVWDYKSIPGYDDFSGAKTLVSSVDDEESLSWEPFGTVKVNDEDEPDFLETKFEDSVTIKFDTTEDNKITAHVSIIEKPETIGSLSHLLEFVLKDDESDGNDTDSGKKVQLRYKPEYNDVLSTNDMILMDRDGKIMRGIPEHYSESDESLLTYKRRENGYRIVSNVPPKKNDSDLYVLVGEKDTGIWWIGSDKIGGKTKIISPLKTIIVNDKDEEGNEYEDVLVEVNYSKFISPDESILIEAIGTGEDFELDFKVDYSKFHSSTNSIEFNADEGLDMNVNLASPDSSILVGTIDESGGIGIMVDYSRFGSSDGSIDIGPGEDGDDLDFRVDYGYFTSEDESLIITELDEGGLDFEVNYEKFYSSDESLIVDPGAEGEGLDLCVDYSRFGSADDSLIIEEIDDGGLDFGINFEMFDSSDGSLFVEPGAEGEGLDLRVDYSRFGSADDSLIIEEISDGGLDFEVNYEKFDSSDGSLFVEPGTEGEGLDLRVDYSKFGSADDSLIIGEIDDGGLNLEVNYEKFDSSDGSLFVEPGVEGEGLDLRVDYSRFFSSDDSIEITELDGGLDFKSDGKVKVSGLDEAGYLAGKVESAWGSIDVTNDGDMLQLDVDWSKVRIDSSLSGLIDIDYSEDGVTLKSALNGNGLIVVENGRLRVLQGQPNSLLACTDNGFAWLPYSDCANACE